MLMQLAARSVLGHDLTGRPRLDDVAFYAPAPQSAVSSPEAHHVGLNIVIEVNLSALSGSISSWLVGLWHHG